MKITNKKLFTFSIWFSVPKFGFSYKLNLYPFSHYFSKLTLVSVLASSAEVRVCDPRPGQNKDFKICICFCG